MMDSEPAMDIASPPGTKVVFKFPESELVELIKDNERLRAQLDLVTHPHKGVTTQATLAHMAQCFELERGPHGKYRCVLPRDHTGQHEYDLTGPPFTAHR